MPRSAGTPCRAAGCTGLSAPGSGYCAEHRRVSNEGRRGSSTQQGYGARWRKFRKMALAREPLCRDCKKAGRLTRATEVHHIKKRSEGGEDSYDNVMCLCKSCHSTRTARGE